VNKKNKRNERIGHKKNTSKLQKAHELNFQKPMNKHSYNEVPMLLFQNLKKYPIKIQVQAP
jgi:hypothetical protein